MLYPDECPKRVHRAGCLWAIALILLLCAEGALAGANNDNVTTSVGTKVRISVVKNDSGFNSNNFQVKVVNAASHGKTYVGGANNVEYTPNKSFSGRDSFVYRLTDNKGFSAKATVTIDVGGGGGGGGFTADSTGAANRRVTLTWNKNGETVDGYYVYFGTKSDNVVLRVATISVNNGTLDRNSPNVRFESNDDLGLGKGDKACFRVQGYNGGGKSPKSSTVCKIL